MTYKKKKTEKKKVGEPLENYPSEPLSFEKVWLMFQETDKMIKESDRKLTEKFQESDKELTKRFRETDKKIKELSNLFTSQWGKLVESLVEGTVIKIFREAGIDVHYTSERVSGSCGKDNFEFDIVAHNETDLVVIEVKTTLRASDVKGFLTKLRKIKEWIPSYKKHKIRGGVAFLTAHAGSDKQAQNSGLYAIKATGDSAHLLNPPDFKPKVF